MSEVLSGLVGIVVGGVLTGAIDQWAGWRKRRRDLRTASRLVFADTVQCEVAFDVALQTHDWWPDNMQPSVEDWRQYRQDLAAAMSSDDLDTVQGAFYQVSNLANQREANQSFGTWGPVVTVAKEAVQEASGVLLAYTRSKRERKRLAKEMEADEPDGANEPAGADADDPDSPDQ